MTYQLERLISSGPTNIDQPGWEVIYTLGMPNGGIAPKAYIAEESPNLLLLNNYGLISSASSG